MTRRSRGSPGQTAPRGGALGATATACQSDSGGCSFAAAIAPPAPEGEADLSELGGVRCARRNFSIKAHPQQAKSRLRHRAPTMTDLSRVPPARAQ